MNLVRCPQCGAPGDPAEELCAYCQGKRSTALAVGLAAAGWEMLLSQGELDWGPPLVIATPATPNERIALRSAVLLDDVHAEVEWRFDAGQAWEKERTASALGVSLRASRSAGYDVAVSVSGVVSISRYAESKLEEWLLEPSHHESVNEGIGVINRLGVSFEDERLSVRMNGRAIASVRDATRGSGAVEIHVRPGSADARVAFTRLAVWEPTQR